MKKLTKSLVIAASLLGIALVTATRLNTNPKHQVGNKLDELNGVAVYFNGAINHTEGRNLIQYRNDSSHAPAAEDLIVFKPWALNPYGHVAIISQVGDDFIEVIQQNAGPFGSTRERYPLRVVNGRARVEHERVLGWLRRPPAPPAKANKDD